MTLIWITPLSAHTRKLFMTKTALEGCCSDMLIFVSSQSIEERNLKPPASFFNIDEVQLLKPQAPVPPVGRVGSGADGVGIGPV